MNRWLQRLAREAGLMLAACAVLLGLAGPARADTHVTSDASAAFHDPLLGEVRSMRSNTVLAAVPVVPITVEFFTDRTYSRRAGVAGIGTRLFLQSAALSCNRNPHVRESMSMTLQSTRTGSRHAFEALETEANSGIFRIDDGMTRDGWSGGSPGPVVMPDDTLVATIATCGRDMQARIMLAPSGVVFDSATDQPIAGVSVTLIDVSGAGNGGRPGEPAVIFDYDGITEVSSTTVTAGDGRFSFRQVPANRYRIDLVVPPQYRRAPVDMMGRMPANRRLAEDASFGSSFSVHDELNPITWDVPLDPLPRALRVQKTVSRASAEVAETVEYTVTTRNIGEVDMADVELNDTLPVGFAFVSGSVRVDGAAAADPGGLPGRALRFPVGALAVNATREVRYRAAIRTAALEGDGINRVVARAFNPVSTTSNVATAAVAVQAGVFTSDTTVLGTIWADCNANGRKDADEPGAPGVRLVMEDGTSVATDAQGRYSLYGISPRTHVLKVDPTSLPAGARMVPLDQRHAGDGNSRFVDPRRSELHRADFAIAGCAADMVAALQARAEVSVADREVRQMLRQALALTRSTQADVKALPSTGIVGDAEVAMPRTIAAAAASASAAGAAPEEGLAFLGLAEAAVLARQPLSVRVQSRAGVPVRLLVDGTAVGDDRIGERSVDAARGLEQRTFVGITLPAGASTLTLVQLDGFGNVREQVERHVRVAGALAQATLTVPSPRSPADGETRVPVVLALADRDGLPVAERRPVTLSASLGDWDVIDLDPVAPGTQTFTDQAITTWMLRAPATAGRADLRAELGDLNATARTDFIAPLRPMVAAGIVEGVLNLRRLGRGAIVAADAADGFEEELRSFATNRDGHGVNGRAALYLKGKVRGDHLLTLGYDSDKDRQTRLFRDIQPDTFYPVYGDDSVKSFDAQSTGRLFVRLEKDKSYVLYGDFTTQSPSPARALGAYQRSLTGARVHHETERVTANVFASQDRSSQVVVELGGNGTSGPYQLNRGNARIHSERVELLVRDRNQPSRVLTTTPQTRFSDYEFEPLSGTLLFRAPVPSVDAGLNPVSVRVTYEVDQGGERFLVAGGDVQVALTDHVEVGGAISRDLNPTQDMTLASVNTTVRLGEHTTVVAEAAQLRRDVTVAVEGSAAGEGESRGGAQRIELQRRTPQGSQLRVFAGRSDVAFVNPSSTLAAGRREAGLKASHPLSASTRLTADALSSADVATDARRHGLLAGVEHSFGTGSKVEGGVRWVEDDPAGDAAPTRTQSVRLKVGTTVPGLPSASVYGEAEQATSDSEKRLIALGGEYQLPSQGRVYLRHELISSLGGPFLLDATQRRNTTVLGVDGDYMKDGRLFGEYRGRDAFGSRETEAAMGLRNRWQVAEGVRLNTTFERVSALSGPGSNDSIALTGAIEYTADPLWKGTARLEARHATAGDTFLSTLGLARKLDTDWTMLAKNIYSTSHGATQPARIQERFQTGIAYRDTATNRFNALTRYEFKREGGMATGDAARRVHSVSTHGDWQPARGLTLTGMHATKWVRETGEALDLDLRAHLMTVRATRDVADRWDVGVAMRLLTDGRFGNRQQGVGVEAGYRLQDQTWVSAGYNGTGFRDRDLAAERDSQRGVYLRLRMKFDESLLSGVSL